MGVGLSACAAAIVIGLFLGLRRAKRRRRASPCRQCTAQMPAGWPSDLCVTCLHVRDELQLLDTGWRGSSSLQWLVRRQGEELGPFGLTALRELAERGKLAAYDRVWTDGMGDWRRVDLIEGLLPGGEKLSHARRSNFIVANWHGLVRRAASWRMGLSITTLLAAAILIAAAAGLRLAGADLRELTLRRFAPASRPQVHTAEPHVIDHGTGQVVDDNGRTRNGFDAARAGLEALFLSVPVFAVLQRLEPATFTNLRETYVSGVLEGAPNDEMSARVRATMMEKVIPKYERMAPDQELIAYWRTQIEKARELRAINPRYCAAFLAPQPGTDNRQLVGLLSPRARQADIRALADLMVAGSEHPQSVPQGEVVQVALRESARRAEQRVPGALQIVANPGTAMTQPSEFCHAEVAFYESILALPTHRAGPLLRYLIAQG